MKKIVYGDGIKQDASLIAFAERAAPILEEVLGQSASNVEAQWDRLVDEGGRTLVTLRISDWTGTAGGKFHPWETELSIRPRLYHLWGDLLAQRSVASF